jgi:hypothetical protein
MLANAPSGQEWFEAQFELPSELFKFDFVVMDTATGGVDNNRARVSYCTAAEFDLLPV